MYLSKDFLALFSKICLLELTIRGEPSSIKGFAMKGYLIKRIPLEVLHSFIELIQSSEHGKKESLQEFQYFKNSFFKNISISRLILIIGWYKRYGNLRWNFISIQIIQNMVKRNFFATFVQKVSYIKVHYLIMYIKLIKIINKDICVNFVVRTFKVNIT